MQKLEVFVDNLNESINNLVTLNKQSALDNINFSNEDWYFSKFCTIQMELPRGAGKTTYILENHTKNDVILFANKQLIELNKSKIIGHAFVCDDPLLHEKLRGLTIENIYIDECYLCFKIISIEKIFKLFRKDCKIHQFIMLGTPC